MKLRDPMAISSALLRRTLRVVAPLILVCASHTPSAVVHGQDSATFEVASIRPSSAQAGPGTSGVRIAGSQVRITGVSLQTFIIFAFQITPQQIVGPDWLGQGRFDLAATIPAGGSPQQVPAMLQTLLADRFQMKMRRELRPTRTYALVVAKGGAKIHPSTVPSATPEATGEKPPAVSVTSSLTSAGTAVDRGGGSSIAIGNNRVEARKMTMMSFADVLSRFVDRLVIDQTGLTGDYDVVLDMAPEDFQALIMRSAFNSGVALSSEGLRMLDAAGPDPLLRALQTVGLTLESHNAPVEVIVVDSIAKTPTEN